MSQLCSMDSDGSPLSMLSGVPRCSNGSSSSGAEEGGLLRVGSQAELLWHSAKCCAPPEGVDGPGEGVQGMAGRTDFKKRQGHCSPRPFYPGDRATQEHCVT